MTNPIKEVMTSGGFPKEDGVYGKCETCEQPIWEHMEENKKIFDETGMCGACATGESAVYTNEL